MTPKLGLNLKQTEAYIEKLTRARGKGGDDPDDVAAYAAGHAFGLNPTGNFKDILESCNIPAMQKDSAKRAWPSKDVASGTTYPTWGATSGLLTPDPF